MSTMVRLHRERSTASSVCGPQSVLVVPLRATGRAHHPRAARRRGIGYLQPRSAAHHAVAASGSGSSWPRTWERRAASTSSTSRPSCRDEFCCNPTSDKRRHHPRHGGPSMQQSLPACSAPWMASSTPCSVTGTSRTSTRRWVRRSPGTHDVDVMLFGRVTYDSFAGGVAGT